MHEAFKVNWLFSILALLKIHIWFREEYVIFLIGSFQIILADSAIDTSI